MAAAVSGSRAVIVHGYQGYPDEAWLPWLKRSLEVCGYAVALPALPQPNQPDLETWIETVARLVGEPDAGVVLVAHSLGAHAVFHYLDRLGRRGKAVGRTVVVAGTFPTGKPPADGDVDETIRAWLSTAADPQSVSRAAGVCTVILSDNDPYIPFAEAKASYPPELRVRLIVEPGKGHFNEDDGMTELPSALQAALG